MKVGLPPIVPVIPISPYKHRNEDEKNRDLERRRKSGNKQK